jgi:hypothetical protein
MDLNNILGIKMLYKYCTIKGFDILLNCRLKAGRVENFNDPFELLLGIDGNTVLSNNQEEYSKNPGIINRMIHILNDQKIIFDKESMEDILNKFSEYQIQGFIKAIEKIREGWNNNMGIVCFSKSNDIIQMWAHYTENHHGIVIGFDENEFLEDKKFLVNICYDDSMVCLPVTGNYEKLNQYEKYFSDVVSRKESKWVYEEEVRLYVRLDEKDEDGNYYVSIPASSIKSVYLGLRSDGMTKFVLESFKQREEYRHLKIYKMVKHDTAFKLKPEEISNL